MTFQDIIEKIADAVPTLPVSQAYAIANALTGISPLAWCKINADEFRDRTASYPIYKKIAFIKALRTQYPYLSLRQAKETVEEVTDP